MNFTLLLINLTCTLIPLLARNKLKGLKWSLFIFFVFLALRYNFGEDYMAYYEAFQNMTFEDRNNSRIEIGYNILCTLFRPIGFYSMIAFLSGLYCFALYSTLKRYISPQWFWLCIFCLISNGDLVFVGCSAIRQTAALSIILLSLPLLEQKKLLWFLGFVALAMCFHRSSFVFAVLYPLINMKLNKPLYVFLIGLSAVLLMTVLQSYFNLLVNNTVDSYFEKYSEGYGDSSGVITGSIGALLIRLMFIVLFLYKMLRENNRIRLVFYVLAILCTVIFIIGSKSMLLRYTLYFGYMMTFCFTYLAEESKTNGKIYAVFSYALIVFWHINLALTFASNSHWYEYHTIFSAF